MNGCEPADILLINIIRTKDKRYRVTLLERGHRLAEHVGSDSDYRGVHGLADGFRQLLKSGGQSRLAAPLLHSVGIELFHVWLAPLWAEINKRRFLNSIVYLILESNVPEILNLPWELLQWPNGVVLSLDPSLFFRRRLRHPVFSPQWSVCHDLPAQRPLKVLWMSASPSGFNRGYADGDWADFFQTISCEGVLFQRVQPATVHAFKQRMQAFEPHIVYWDGAALIRGEQGFFVFEDDEGQADILSATEITQTVFAHQEISMLILSGREPNHASPVAATAALCQTFFWGGVDLVLAWPIRLTEPFFRLFFQALLQNAASGVGIDLAIQRAREVLRPECEIRGFPNWTLPVLYA